MYDNHTLYTSKDFTSEEVAVENVLAMAVIRDGISICKQCGKTEDELTEPCETPRQKTDRLSELYYVNDISMRSDDDL
jgi:hypothetical protein